MKKVLVFFLFTFVLLSAQSPEAPKVVPVAEEGHHHLVLENEYVKVFQVEVPAHSETLYHQHDRDYIFVTLGDSVVENVRLNEKPAKLELKDGEARFTKGGFAHKAVNLSDKPFRNVTVELKNIPSKEIDCIKSDRVECWQRWKQIWDESSPASTGIEEHRILAVNGIRISEVRVPPGRSLGFKDAGNSMIVLSTDGITTIGPGIGVRNAWLEPGALFWTNQVGSIMAMDKTKGLRFIEIHFYSADELTEKSK